MKLNTLTFAGIGVGLLAGYLLLKNKQGNKKYLMIGGIGLAGGILGNLISKLRETQKLENITTSSKNYVESTDNEMTDDETGNIELVQNVPKMSAELRNTSPTDYFDIDLGFNKD